MEPGLIAVRCLTGFFFIMTISIHRHVDSRFLVMHGVGTGVYLKEMIISEGESSAPHELKHTPICRPEIADQWSRYLHIHVLQSGGTDQRESGRTGISELPMSVYTAS